jgi:thiamine-phosphate pyrophosphorylase
MAERDRSVRLPGGFSPTMLRLVAITDDLRDGVEGLVARALAAERGGSTMVQLRLKHVDARTLATVGSALGRVLSVPLVVNDRLDVALACNADGVHLGYDDLPVNAARRLAPVGFIVGASVGDDNEVPNGRDADYVGIGPVYPTTSKSDAGQSIGVAGFGRLRELCGRPAVAIGGIAPSNAAEVMAAGADGVAVIRAVFGPDDPSRAAATLRSAIGR